VRLDLDVEGLCVDEELAGEELYLPGDSSGGSLTDALGWARLTIGDSIETSKGMLMGGYRKAPYRGAGVEVHSFLSPAKRELNFWLSVYGVEAAVLPKLSRERERRRCTYFLQQEFGKL